MFAIHVGEVGEEDLETTVEGLSRCIHTLHKVRCLDGLYSHPCSCVVMVGVSLAGVWCTTGLISFDL